MSKKEKFYNLCKIMANTEDVIQIFENIGLNVEPNTDSDVGYLIYNIADIAFNLILSLLNVPKEDEDCISNKLFAAINVNIVEIADEIWSKYGTEETGVD